jgi:hypothetical protein
LVDYQTFWVTPHSEAPQWDGRSHLSGIVFNAISNSTQS